jgi:hypothetical protein
MSSTRWRRHSTEGRVAVVAPGPSRRVRQTDIPAAERPFPRQPVRPASTTATERRRTGLPSLVCTPSGHRPGPAPLACRVALATWTSQRRSHRSVAPWRPSSAVLLACRTKRRGKAPSGDPLDPSFARMCAQRTRARTATPGRGSERHGQDSDAGTGLPVRTGRRQGPLTRRRPPRSRPRARRPPGTGHGARRDRTRCRRASGLRRGGHANPGR